jgi:hypothetical protein
MCAHILVNFSTLFFIDAKFHVIIGFFIFVFKFLDLSLLYNRYPGSEFLQLAFVWKRFYFHFAKIIFHEYTTID